MQAAPKRPRFALVMFVGQQNHGFALIFKEREKVLFALFACKIYVRDAP